MAWTETETSIMRDIFLLMKRNADAQDTDEYWGSMMEQVNQIMKKYNGHELASDMCVAACLYYENKLKAIKGTCQAALN